MELVGYGVLILLIVIMLLTMPKNNMMQMQEIHKQQIYEKEMIDLFNITDSCLPRESFTEHFQDQSIAEETIETLEEQGNITTETRSDGILNEKKVYCPSEELT